MTELTAPEPARDAADSDEAECFGGCTDPDCMGECINLMPG